MAGTLVKTTKINFYIMLFLSKLATQKIIIPLCVKACKIC